MGLFNKGKGKKNLSPEEVMEQRKAFMSYQNYDEKMRQVKVQESKYYQTLNKLPVDTSRGEEYVNKLEAEVSQMKYCRTCGELSKPIGNRCPQCGKKY
jgi:tRNA G26 N,N-dimethylase Trm1